MGFEVYIRQALEGGKVIFPSMFCQTCEEHQNGEKLKCLQCLRSSKTAHSYSCTPHETPILMGDFSFRPISDLNIGDEVIGWQDFSEGKKRPEAKWQRAKVKNIFVKKDDVYTYTLASGRTVRCTTDHRWYSGRRDSTHRLYREPKVNENLQFVCDPSLEQCPPDKVRDAAWLGGVFDGEGSCSEKGPGIFISQCRQHNPIVQKEIGEALTRLGFDWCYTESSTSFFIKGGFREKIRFLHWCKPYRWEKIANNLLALGRRFTKPDKILKEEKGRRESVYALETETGNYIAWGYASKNCQYFNDPVDDSTVEFKREWLQSFDMTDETRRKLDRAEALLSIDPAFRLKETNDFSGLVLTKTTEDNLVYVMEAKQKKLNSADLVDEIFKLVKIYSPHKVLVETVSAQLLLVDILKGEMRKRNVFFSIEEMKPSTKETKAMRIRGLIPHYANGRILHRRGLHELEDQLVQFPRNVHDDIIDALAYQAKFWKGIHSPAPRRGPQEFSLDWWKGRIPENLSQKDRIFKGVTKRKRIW